MKKITSVLELKEHIFLLEAKRASEKQLLKDEFRNLHEDLKPVNLIKNAVSELTSLPDFKGNILNAVVSIAAGFFSKKITVGSTHNPIKQLLGTLLQMGVTNVVSKNGEKVNGIAKGLIRAIFKKKDTT